MNYNKSKNILSSIIKNKKDLFSRNPWSMKIDNVSDSTKIHDQVNYKIYCKYLSTIYLMVY